MALMQSLEQVLVLAFGARETVTIEYNRVDYSDRRMRTLTPDQYWGGPPPGPALDNAAGPGPGPVGRQRFALALSISSFEHDGLGRYGDPLNPEGDLAAMAQMEVRVRVRSLL